MIAWILVLMIVGDSPAITTVSGFKSSAECEAVGQRWKQTKVNLERDYYCLVATEDGK